MPEPTSSAPLRVLFLDHTSELGGAERSMLDLIGRLDPARVMPFVATSPGGPLVERLDAMGVPVVPLAIDPAALMLSREEWSRNPLAVAWRARGFARALWQLVRLVRTHAIDLIHTNTLKAHVLGSLLARLTGRPIVWHMRDLPSSRGDARRLLARLDRLVKPAIIAISQAVADDLPAPMRDRTRVVYNGLDLARFDERAREPAIDLPLPAGEGPLIGTLSHLIPWKGQGIFLQAAAQLASAHADWRFLVVGDPIFQFRDERDRLETLASELGIAGRVGFAGHREDAPAVMAALDMFVLPSLYEPFGRVLIEAMGAARPIVASRAGGVPEIVQDGETGLLVPPGDPEALAAAIARLVADPALATRLGQAARERVERYFSLEATVRGVMAVYAEIGRAGPGRSSAG